MWQQKSKNSCNSAYARAREKVRLQVFSQFILWFFICFLMRDNSTPNRSIKTSRCFMKNEPSFYEKQHVVLSKTTRRFMENNTSFYGKQHVVLRRTTRRFRKHFLFDWEVPQIGHSLWEVENQFVLLPDTTTRQKEI